MKTYRAFINQPSSSQPLHTMHGKRCIVQDWDGNDVTVFFTEGPVQSMVLSRLTISRLHLSSADNNA